MAANAVVAAAEKAAGASFDILNDVSPWIIISLIIAGLLHAVLKPDNMQRMLGNKKISSIVKATLSGMLLPVCSCGVIPLGLGMYYSGAYLGPALAFMVATPIVNPAAVLLAYGLLGPEIATIYLVSGFLLPVIIGYFGNIFAGEELHAPGMESQINAPQLESDSDVGFIRKLITGLEWGFKDLGVMTGKYIIFGIVLAGIILAVMPPAYIQNYLGNPGLISIAGIAALGAVLYVCAVGHIPLVAALVASGAAPGIAVTFLMTGAATNLPELVSIYKLIGRRAVLMYAGMLTCFSVAIGFFTNWLLMPGFVPFFNLDKSREIVGAANLLILSVPEPVQYICSFIIVLLCVYSLWPKLRGIIPFKSLGNEA